MEEKLTFGKYVLQKRKEAGLSQKQLAEALFITESAVSKWERGVSYPDIALVAPICNVLGISEHELITATDDRGQRELERQARSLQTIVKTYSWVFYILYGVSLAACFICNLAVNHTLSWFFIVLAAELVAFSLTNVPLLVSKRKGLATLGSFYLSLNLLLLVCCVAVGGAWFPLVFVCLLFSFTVLFLPFVIRETGLPQVLERHKALFCIGADTLLLFLVVAVSCLYAGQGESLFPKAFPITAFSLILPWSFLIVIRYLRCNSLYKTALCFLIGGIYSFFINGVMRVILDAAPLQIEKSNLMNWSVDYITGNVLVIILLACCLLSVLFTIGGLALTVKKRNA